MKMVLLTIMPPWGAPTVPIGLGYLSEFLTDHGVKHEVLDLNMEIYRRLPSNMHHLWTPQTGDEWVHPDKFAKLLGNIEDQLEWAVEQLVATDCDLVGFSVNQSNARFSLEAAQRLKERCPERIIVFGGLGVYIHGERRLIPKSIVDHFVIGEGEITLLRLVEKLQAHEPLEGTTGTVSHPADLKYVPRPQVDLLQHPWPTYREFDPSRYPGAGRLMPINLGRGCVCRCSFCGDYPFWGKFRSRDGQRVVDEIRHHFDHFGTREFEFNDLAINSDKEALEAMCDGIIAEDLEIHWSSYAYLTRLPQRLVPKLKLSGCDMLRFGMESASDSVLKRMHKPHRAQVASEVFKQLFTAGINCNIGLMTGFPGETDEELDQTIAFLQENQQYIHEVDSLSVFYIKPLSHIEQHPEEFGIIFPEDHSIRWNQWIGDDGSTYDKRKERARRLMDAIEDTSIRFQRCNVIGL